MPSAGTSVRESVTLIEGAGARTAGVAIALDRQERTVGEDPRSAVQFVENSLNLAVVSIATLSDLLQYLGSTEDAELASHRERVQADRVAYGA